MSRTWSLLFVTLLATARFQGCPIGVMPGPLAIHRIDHLKDSRKVAAVSAGSLVLEEDQRIRLPHVESFPARSQEALKWLVERGVEISSEGRVFGLVKIHHWCGNDPVKLEIVRVDLAEVLAYIGQGGIYRELCQKKPTLDVCHNYTGEFSSRGWMVGEYSDFVVWRQSGNPSSHYAAAGHSRHLDFLPVNPREH